MEVYSQRFIPEQSPRELRYGNLEAARRRCVHHALADDGLRVDRQRRRRLVGMYYSLCRHDSWPLLLSICR